MSTIIMVGVDNVKNIVVYECTITSRLLTTKHEQRRVIYGMKSITAQTTMNKLCRPMLGFAYAIID